MMDGMTPSGLSLRHAEADGVPQDVLDRMIFFIEMDWNNAQEQGYYIDCQHALKMEIRDWRKQQAAELRERMEAFGIDEELTESLMSGETV